MDEIETVKQINRLNQTIRDLRTTNEQQNYDLSRVEFLLGECIELIKKVGNRAENEGDAFTHLWCEEMIFTVYKTLDLPRFGVDVISWRDIREDKK